MIRVLVCSGQTVVLEFAAHLERSSKHAHAARAYLAAPDAGRAAAALARGGLKVEGREGVGGQ